MKQNEKLVVVCNDDFCDFWVDNSTLKVSLIHLQTDGLKTSLFLGWHNLSGASC